ncbi:MAG: recombination protein RecR [Bacteroidetes bacterium]|jgi:recombination protein RecR|nr:recombination protein RecR [Bacteroidota bacterium]
MAIQQFPSKLLEEAVFEFSKLPGIGEKTALRLVLHLLKQESVDIKKFGQTLQKLADDIVYCRQCGNISDTELCGICASEKRDNALVCVVENIRDVLAVESTHQFNGTFNVLGAVISPIDGIGPADLNLSKLEERIKDGEVQEIILALSSTLEGDTTNFYIYKRFKNFPVKITSLAKGIAIGNELEYTDEITLGQSIVNRTPFHPG